MKVRNVKFYQAISLFDGVRNRTLTHINKKSPELAGKIEMSIIDGVGLLLETDADRTIVTLNNIAYMNLELEEKIKAPKKQA